MKELSQMVRPGLRHLVALDAEAALACSADRPTVSLASPRGYRPAESAAPLSTYPDIAPLVEVIARSEGLHPDCVVLTAGAYGATELLLRTFCRSGRDNILLPSPGLLPADRIAAAADIEVRRIEVAAPQFVLTPEAVAARRDERTKLLLLRSPADPTGVLTPADTLRSIAAVYDGLIVVDESYIAYARRPSVLADTTAPLPKHLVVVRSFTHTFSAPGLRLGYIVASPAICRYLRAASSPWIVSTPTIKAALQRLTHRSETDRRISHLIDERRRVMISCAALPVCEHVYPSHAPYFLLRLTPEAWQQVHSSDHPLWTAISRPDAVVDVSVLPGLERCLRISCALSTEGCALLSVLRGL